MKMSVERWWNDIDGGKLKYWEKTCTSATFSATNLTWTDLGSNLDLRGERPATDRLSDGTAFRLKITSTTRKNSVRTAQ
jgi:hypothetical protein